MPKSLSTSKLDEYFSRALRASYDHVCQFPDCPECGNVQGGADDCSHYYGRRYRGGRWFPDNCLALCRQIHGYVDKHKAAHADLMRRHLGETRHDMLVERLQRNHHYTPYQRWEMGQHFRDELKRINERRLDGETGFISLTSFD